MAELSTLARPYAKAVFELAGGDLASWSDALAAISAVVSDPATQALLGNPKVTRQQLASLIEEVCKNDLNESAGNLVRLLAENDRLSLAPHIAEQYEEMRAEAEGRMDVTVTAATELSEDRRLALSEALCKRLGKEVSIALKQDPELLGGAIIRAGDLVIDGSVRTELARIKSAIAH